MTLEQTRQLGIEFERRVQTMIPETEFAAKLDTETIYSYLNQYQDKLIHDLYNTIDQIPVSNTQTYLETLLNSMMSTEVLTPSETRPICRCELPDNFGLYIKSYSNVKSSYRFKAEYTGGTVPNELISVKDVNKVISRPQDSMRILRSPIVWLADNNGLGVLYDSYTEPDSIQLEYYRVPQYMNLMTSTKCELPMEMFEQLVSGAVDLYVQYVAGAEAKRRQQQEQAAKRAREDQRDSRRSGGNQDEQS